PGLDLACDLLLVESAVGTKRDQGRRGLLAVTILERPLHRLQLRPVHRPHMVARRVALTSTKESHVNSRNGPPRRVAGHIRWRPPRAVGPGIRGGAADPQRDDRPSPGPDRAVPE